MSTTENPDNLTLPSIFQPRKPARQKHFLMRQTDEKWANEMAEYESDLLAWKRGLNPSLTRAALDRTLTAKMIIEAIESEIELVRHKNDFWRDNHPSALWVMENTDLFGSLPPTERTEVILQMAVDSLWGGRIGEKMLVRYPTIFFLVEDMNLRWLAIKMAIQFVPSYEEWRWLESLAEHHDHVHLRKLVLDMVTTLPIHRDSVLPDNPQYASQAITCQHWAIYEGNLEAFLEMTRVFAVYAPTFLLNHWEVVVIKIGELVGFTAKGGKKLAELHDDAIRSVDAGLPFDDTVDEMDAIHRRNNARAYKLGMEHAEDLFQTMLVHLTVITGVGIVKHFPLDIQMRILCQVEHNDAWLDMLITLVYKLGEDYEHSDELRKMLVDALYTTDRPDKFYRMVANHCPDKKVWDYRHRWYNGFKGTQLDLLLRKEMQLLGWGFHTVTYRQPNRPTRSYHKRSYDGLQVVFRDAELGKQMVLKILPVGYDHFTRLDDFDVFRRGVEVIVQLRPDEKHLVYENDRTRIYADVQVYRSLCEYNYDYAADDHR